MSRRCGVCGRFARVVILDVSGLRLGWEHGYCARVLGMWAPR